MRFIIAVAICLLMGSPAFAQEVVKFDDGKFLWTWVKGAGGDVDNFRMHCGFDPGPVSIFVDVGVLPSTEGPDKFEAFGLFLEGIQSAFPEMPPPPQPPAVFSLANPERFKAEMEAAGFGEVEVDLGLLVSDDTSPGESSV